MASELQSSLSWTSSPLIVSAPMGGFAGPDLAIAVSKAGGLGQIGAVMDMTELDKQLAQVTDAFRSDSRFNLTKTLPIGVGLLPFILKMENTLPVLAKHHPAVVWLFAAKELSDYSLWTAKIREVCAHSQIWIQIGSVTGALAVAESCRPDALILQGIDAGGHGFEKGAGIVTLLPETSDALAKAGLSDIPLLASGGIVEGRAAAAAFSLGAQGVVLGTRFLASNEVTVHPKYQEGVVAARDGGQSTVRAKLFDELRGPNIWPGPYDGRSLVTNSYTDFASGLPINRVRDLHTEALKEKDMGWGESNRATIWAGTGVGLVNKVQSAAEIVHEVREGACKALKAAQGRL